MGTERIPLRGRSLLRLKKRRKTVRMLLILSEAAAVLVIAAIILPILLRERIRDDVTIAQVQELLDEQRSPAEEELLKAPGTAADLRRVYRIFDLSSEYYYLRLPASNMDVTEEIFLIADSPEKAEDYQAKLNARLASRKNDFESYGTEQMKVLNQAQVVRKGNYVFLIISPDAEAKREALLKWMR